MAASRDFRLHPEKPAQLCLSRGGRRSVFRLFGDVMGQPSENAALATIDRANAKRLLHTEME